MQKLIHLTQKQISIVYIKVVFHICVCVFLYIVIIIIVITGIKYLYVGILQLNMNYQAM